MKAITGNNLLQFLLKQNKEALFEFERAAVKYYNTQAPVQSNQPLIPQAWIASIADELLKYNLGVYPLNAEDVAERTKDFEGIGVPKIIAFKKRGQ